MNDTKLYKNILRFVIWLPYISLFSVYIIDYKLGFNLYDLYMNILYNYTFTINFFEFLFFIYWFLFFNLINTFNIYRKVYYISIIFDLKFYSLVRKKSYFLFSLLKLEIYLKQNKFFFKFLYFLDRFYIINLSSFDLDIRFIFDEILIFDSHLLKNKKSYPIQKNGNYKIL